MQDFLNNKTPQDKAFNLPHGAMASRMIQADLKPAGVEYKTDEGCCDFHSLRGTFCTDLVSAGVEIHNAQKLMRHKNIKTTMKYYVHIHRPALVDAIERLDVLTKTCPENKQQKTA